MLIAAIHDYKPKLPWYFYVLTQARVHLWVMKAFGRHLAKVDRRTEPQREAEPESIPEHPQPHRERVVLP